MTQPLIAAPSQFAPKIAPQGITGNKNITGETKITKFNEMYLNSFGHEVAHNFGADHNREAFQNTDFKAPYEDAYGYWIKVRPPNTQIHKYSSWIQILRL